MRCAASVVRGAPVWKARCNLAVRGSGAGARLAAQLPHLARDRALLGLVHLWTGRAAVCTCAPSNYSGLLLHLGVALLPVDHLLDQPVLHDALLPRKHLLRRAPLTLELRLHDAQPVLAELVCLLQAADLHLFEPLALRYLPWMVPVSGLLQFAFERRRGRRSAPSSRRHDQTDGAPSAERLVERPILESVHTYPPFLTAAKYYCGVL